MKYLDFIKNINEAEALTQGETKKYPDLIGILSIIAKNTQMILGDLDKNVKSLPEPTKQKELATKAQTPEKHTQKPAPTKPAPTKPAPTKPAPTKPAPTTAEKQPSQPQAIQQPPTTQKPPTQTQK